MSLPKNEHTTAEFQAINPKGVVPVLVHDGATINESNDIISYLDDTFPARRLMPEHADDQAFVRKAVEVTDGIQPALKLLSHEFLFKPVRRMTPKQLAEFAMNSKNEALVQFMRDFSSKEGFGRSRIAAAIGEFTTAFAELEARLSTNAWLSGPAFGIADISWIVNVHRVATARYPLRRFPKLTDWYRRMKERPSFKFAIADYEDKGALRFFAVYTLWRRLRGTAIVDYM